MPKHSHLFFLVEFHFTILIGNRTSLTSCITCSPTKAKKEEKNDLNTSSNIVLLSQRKIEVVRVFVKALKHQMLEVKKGSVHMGLKLHKGV